MNIAAYLSYVLGLRRGLSAKADQPGDVFGDGAQRYTKVETGIYITNGILRRSIRNDATDDGPITVQ